MLILTSALMKQIEAHGIEAYPYEGCGLLLGMVEGSQNVVTAIRPMENVWPVEQEKTVRFRIDEKAWLGAELWAMSQGVDIIGIFHSHPDCPPIASPRDLAWASWPGYSYLITEIRMGISQESRSWQLNNEYTDFVEEIVMSN